MNHIKLLFFATVRERMGVKSLDLELPAEATIGDLKVNLSEKYPKIKDSLKSVLVTINREYAFDEAIIPSKAEIGVFPPVSGG
ncbi:MAG: molybdopterin converting factor subunit 1 [Anaerolineales bacterium]|nr:molybdopterin converting factor subunit 1 [Anaerolineales bacterium]